MNNVWNPLQDSMDRAPRIEERRTESPLSRRQPSRSSDAEEIVVIDRTRYDQWIGLPDRKSA